MSRLFMSDLVSPSYDNIYCFSDMTLIFLIRQFNFGPISIFLLQKSRVK